MCILMDQFLLPMVELKWDKDFTQKWCRLVDKIRVEIPLVLSQRNGLRVKFYFIWLQLFKERIVLSTG